MGGRKRFMERPKRWQPLRVIQSRTIQDSAGVDVVHHLVEFLGKPDNPSWVNATNVDVYGLIRSSAAQTEAPAAASASAAVPRPKRLSKKQPANKRKRDDDDLEYNPRRPAPKRRQR